MNDEIKELTNAEKRRDYYEHSLAIKFGDDLITYDRARELYGSYSIIGDESKCADLKSEMSRVHKYVNELFPD